MDKARNSIGLQTLEPTTKSFGDLAALDKINDRLQRLIKSFTDSGGQISAALDRAFGPDPEAGSVKARDGVSGNIGVIYSSLDELEAISTRFSDESDRLSRLV